MSVLASGLVVALRYFARDVIVPVALAVLLSFLVVPAVRWLRRWRIAGVPAVSLTVLVAFFALIGFTAELCSKYPRWHSSCRRTVSTSKPKSVRCRRPCQAALAHCDINRPRARQRTKGERRAPQLER